MNIFKPFRIMFEGIKYTLKGARWVLNRPETSLAAMVLPGLGYAKAANLLILMKSAEAKYPDRGTGVKKLYWVIQSVHQCLKDNPEIDLPKVNDKKLREHIEALMPIIQGWAIMAEAARD